MGTMNETVTKIVDEMNEQQAKDELKGVLLSYLTSDEKHYEFIEKINSILKTVPRD